MNAQEKKAALENRVRTILAIVDRGFSTPASRTALEHLLKELSGINDRSDEDTTIALLDALRTRLADVVRVEPQCLEVLKAFDSRAARSHLQAALKAFSTFRDDPAATTSRIANEATIRLQGLGDQHNHGFISSDKLLLEVSLLYEEFVKALGVELGPLDPPDP